MLESPRFRTKKTMEDRLFMVAAPVLWNNLPLLVRQAESIDPFKRLVRVVYFLRHFVKIFGTVLELQSLAGIKVFLFSPSLLLLFKPKTVQNFFLYYLSVFLRLSAVKISLAVNKTLGDNASHSCTTRAQHF